ncbi:hypothetical protein [Rubrolithibacter danxiaensis]|uniref:hypothetical protein n=1 Tax=Rubrolithibacter danxiaensis TaxID=3390805 RepID=UPI003BF8C597
MKLFQKLVLISFFLFVSFSDSYGQQAEKKTSPFRFLIKGGLEFGGDDVAEVYFEDGDKQSVKAGQGGSVGIGAEFQVPAVKKLLFHATAGYKFVTTKADNANIRLSRIPILFTANWLLTKKLRFGAGIASHQGIRFKADGLGEDITFRSATGPTVELAYSGIGLTYTAMTYKDQANNNYSANAVGLSLTLALPKR